MMLSPAAATTPSTTFPAVSSARPAAVTACQDDVEVVTDYTRFLGLEAEWNDAVERARVAYPFLRHEWIQSWWEAFGAGKELHVIVVRNEGRIAAIAPLMRESIAMYGMPVRRLRLIQNDHTPRIDFVVASETERACRAIWNVLRNERPRWDVLLLSQIDKESATGRTLARLAASDGCATGVWQSNDSPYLALTGTWDTYLNGLPAKFRSNLRNRLSRATRIGDTELEVLAGADAAASAEDVWRLERSGWKHESGTAITSDPAVHAFYHSLIERGNAAGWLRILFLRIAGRRMATAYSACSGQRLFLIKTGYDPEYATCAPFKLLTNEAIRHAYAEGLSEVDFLGDNEPWKLEWTTTVRGHDWWFVFARNARARLLHSMKFQWAPALRRWRR